jgi:Reverse transcriptase (RNA-dependent DNA polymerase)/Endonuclease/Exonuclease/phosphatase family
LLQYLMIGTRKRNIMPARTSPGQTRSAPPFQGLGGGEKLAMGARLRIGSANVGTMKGRSLEVVEMVERRRLDFCCLQETRWKGGNARTFGRYKFFWSGCEGGTAGVGVLVADKWVDHVLEVKRISERIMVLRVKVEKSVLNLITVYAPQVGRPMEEKEEFFVDLRKILSSVARDERLVVCGDLNAHVGTASDGFEGVHGGHGFGVRNVEGEMLLEFADALDLAVANTWFKKTDGQLVTYESGGCRTTVDYILVRQCERALVGNVTVMQGEAVLQQHKLLVCMLAWKELNKKKKREKFTSRCKVWKLREAQTRSTFQSRVEARLNVRAMGNVEEVWCGLKDCLLEEAEKVCGKTKGPRRHNETWFWSDEVGEVVKEKQRQYHIFDKAKKMYETFKTDANKKTMEVAKKSYQQAKRNAKQAVSKAQEEERKRFGDELDDENRKGTVFRVARQMVRKNRDVVGGGCVRDTNGRMVVEDEERLEVWRAYYDKLSNEEFPWNKDALTVADVKSGPSEQISPEEVRAAIEKMKNNKAAGPSGVVADMVKAAGEAGIIWVTDMCNAVVRDGRIPADWCKSWMVNVYKGKGDAMECGSYRGIKLLEHVMKILERVIECRVRNIVKIDEMQCGFMPGKGTTDAIFIVRQLQEKHLAKNKDLWMAFVDLEKAFDRVPREVVWWALRTLGVDEWLITVIKAMYVDATTSVRLSGIESRGFKVKVGVHQGSVLSPLLFVIVLEALSRTFRGGLPMEILYADDLVLMAESEELLIEKFRKWRTGLEEKGLRVNMGKTKVMRCHVSAHQAEESGKYPCGVCKKGVGRNSIRCTSCLAWIHKKCSGISGSLQNVKDYQCKRCRDGNPTRQDALKEVSLGTREKLECVEKFCYLGDMIGAGGGAEVASRTRVRCAWGKFKELAPILTSRGASLKVKGKVYRACVQRVLVHGSETWPMKIEDMKRLERTERMMVRWMCGVTLKNKIANVDLNRRLDIECVADVVRRGRLRWLGHLERKDRSDWVSACRNFKVEGVNSRGRSRKTWDECVRNDMKFCDLRIDQAQDRAGWRRLIMRKTS